MYKYKKTKLIEDKNMNEFVLAVKEEMNKGEL